MFEQVCIIGLGLIGASLAQAIRDRGLSKRIVAVDQYALSIEAAVNEAVIDAGCDNLLDIVAGCDCIVIAVPVKAVKAVFEDIHIAIQRGLVAPSCLLSDVCSTKQNVVQAATEVFGDLPTGLVPAHPIAGAEHSGFHARRSQLFVNHNVIVCELASTHPQSIVKITELWEAVGAVVMTMEVAHHDAVLAYTSHLPHLLAFNLVDQLASHNDNMDIFRYAAGGFRDFTRIAASDPTMWHDIFIANKSSLITALDEYTDYLANLRNIIQNEDSTELLGLLGRAQSARQHFNHMLTGTPYTQALNDDTKGGTTLKSVTLVANPSKYLKGTLVLVGDKSISHRSIILGSLAEGITKVSNVLASEDTLATLQAFRDMGVVIEDSNPNEIVIHGVGMNGLQPSRTALYMGGSETSMRLLTGLLAAQTFDSVLTGDTYLSKYAMEQVAKPLRQMGASIQTTGERGTAPISILGSVKRQSQLQGVTYVMPVSSAQVKSSLLLAGLWAIGQTTVIEPDQTRNHTEQMLSAFGYPIHIDGNKVTVGGGGQLCPCDLHVPADISVAAYFMVAASIASNSKITLKRVGINPTRIGIIEVLRLMGADITFSHRASSYQFSNSQTSNYDTSSHQNSIDNEPAADITIKSTVLTGIHIPEHLVSTMVDELPALFIAASCAVGETVLSQVTKLNAKVTKRINIMMDALTDLGIQCTVTKNDIIIHGKGIVKEDKSMPRHNDIIFKGGEVSAHADTYITMGLAVAALRAKETVIVHNIGFVSTDFMTLANSIGMDISMTS